MFGVEAVVERFAVEVRGLECGDGTNVNGGKDVWIWKSSSADALSSTNGTIATKSGLLRKTCSLVSVGPTALSAWPLVFGNLPALVCPYCGGCNQSRCFLGPLSFQYLIVVFQPFCKNKKTRSRSSRLRFQESVDLKSL